MAREVAQETVDVGMVARHERVHRLAVSPPEPVDEFGVFHGWAVPLETGPGPQVRRFYADFRRRHECRVVTDGAMPSPFKGPELRSEHR